MFSKPFTHQTQPTPMSCVCTCLAMLMDEPANDVIEKYHDKFFAEKSIEVSEILQQEGFIFTRQLAGTVTTIWAGAVYMLTVASLNIPGGLHQILVDYRDPTKPQVLDPAKGYGKRKYYTLDHNEVDENPQAFLLFSWIIDHTITDRS